MHTLPLLWSFLFFQITSGDDQKPNLDAYSSQETVNQAYDDCDNTPLVLDLNGDGFMFSGPEKAVWFDLNGIGEPIRTQWVGGDDDAFLIRDTNGNGIVDDGSELFGSGTPLRLQNNIQAVNGFAALAQFDDPRLGGNDDGFISAKDEVWQELALWLDRDFDGVCTKDEIHDLNWVQISAIRTIPRISYNSDHFGNVLNLWAWAYQLDYKHKINMVDVSFGLADPSRHKHLGRVSEAHPYFLDSVDYANKTVPTPETDVEPIALVDQNAELFKEAYAQFKAMAKAKKPLPAGIRADERSMDLTGFFHPKLVDLSECLWALTDHLKSNGHAIGELEKRGMNRKDLDVLIQAASSGMAYPAASLRGKEAFFERHYKVSRDQPNKQTMRLMQKDWVTNGQPRFKIGWSKKILNLVSRQGQRILIDTIYDIYVPAYYGHHWDE